jgi:hypothetical protein
MVDSTSSKAIYRTITAKLRKNDYTIDTAMTISGRYEGLYAWIAAGIRNSIKQSNYGIIEIGGASVQQTFPDRNGKISRFGMNIHSKSYLGWGANEIDTTENTYKTKRNYETANPNLQNPEGILFYKLGGGFKAFGNDYGKWLINNIPAEFPKNTSEWTEGAAVDIIINKETPECFDYINPN